MDINNLTNNDALSIFFVDGLSCSDSLDLAEKYELSPEDTNKLCDFLESYQVNESEVVTASVFDGLREGTFRFGSYLDGFSFESQVSYTNYDDLGNSPILNVNGFFLFLPEYLTMIKVGSVSIYFGFSNDISYRVLIKD